MACAKIHVAVRLDPEDLARVEALIPVLSTRWHGATRSDALRALVLHGLETFPTDAGGGGGRGAGEGLRARG